MSCIKMFLERAVFEANAENRFTITFSTTAAPRKCTSLFFKQGHDEEIS